MKKYREAGRVGIVVVSGNMGDVIHHGSRYLCVFVIPCTMIGEYGGSRFDFYVEAGERKIFIEVKGVTLEENGVVLFPDAPTLRGVKHLTELAGCVRAGYDAHVVFVVQMKDVLYFTPNIKTHPAFGEALAATAAAGVAVVALDCKVGPDKLEIGDGVPVKMS